MTCLDSTCQTLDPLVDPTLPQLLAPTLPSGQQGLTQQEPQDPWSLISLMVGQFGHCSRASKLSGRTISAANASLKNERSSSQVVTLQSAPPTLWPGLSLGREKHQDVWRGPCTRTPLGILLNFFFFLLRHAACRMLVPRPGIETMPSGVIAWSPNLCTARELPTWSLMKTNLGSTPPNNLPFCLLLPKPILCRFLKGFNLRVQIITSLAFPTPP